MTRRLLALLSLCCLFSAVAYADAPHQEALKSYASGLDARVFASARLSTQDRLILTAGPVYLSTGTQAQASYVKAESARWKDALSAAGVSEDKPSILVVDASGGALWRQKGTGYEKFQEWSDRTLAYAPGAAVSGRWFGFLGAQTVMGTTHSTGMNARLGTTLFQNRYDLSGGLGYNTVNTNPSVSMLSLSVAGRALFPIDPTMGWNAGLQLQHSAPSSGSTYDVFSALVGLNFYLPGGSFDVTGQVGNHSTYGLLAGYTFYLNR